MNDESTNAKRPVCVDKEDRRSIIENGGSNAIIYPRSSMIKVPELRLENSVVDDHYLVERCLGRGSYAEIFLAFDRRTKDQLVIIKSLNTTLQGTPDPELEQTLVENFQNEAIALDRVRHPNIIQRLGHGTAADLDGVPFHYLVLEYMPGGGLWSLCRKRPVSLDDAVFYFQQVAEALAYAHSERIIHRDIKPNNLLLSADQRVLKIADFGVAKMTHDEASEITRVGTNIYAPPEHHPDVRADELSERLTPSADVYSLAKTIYTAMTGRAPRQFSREPIRELPPELAAEPWSGALLQVLSKATASRVIDRFQSVEEFWAGFAQVRVAGIASREDDDEATVVRTRLSAASTADPVVDRPNFQTLAYSAREVARTQKARIVVELPSHSERRGVVESPSDGDEEPADRAADEQIEDRARQPGFGTQTFGAPDAANGSQAQIVDRRRDVAVATQDGRAVTMTPRTANIHVIRPERGAFDRMRAFISSEWLRRVFIIFLAAALIGLAASTYYHFADQKAGIPLFGLQNKEGRISGALNVNLRSEPFGAVLVTMPEKTRVRVIEERNGWFRIKILEWVGTAPENASDTGWVDGRFVKID